MKFLRIIILIALVVSFMPLDAFCDSHQQESKHHHGVVLCHASCHGAVLTGNSSAEIPDTFETAFNVQNGFIYEAPFLPTEERPPLSLLS